MFKRLKQRLMKRLNISNPSRVLFISSDNGYIKPLEKRGLSAQMKTTFDSPIIQKRYDDIVTALKYTKHSKKRECLLKAKRMYEKHLIMEE